MRLSYYILSLSLFTTLIQCGGEAGPSGQVSVTISPSRPNIYLSDLPIPISSTEKVTITAPYIAVSIAVTNSSTETVNVTAVRLEVTYDSTDKNGVTTELQAGPIDVGPASFTSFGYDYIKSTPSCNSAIACDQSVFARLTRTDTEVSAFTFKANDGGTDFPLRFYFSGLPKNDGKNFTYRMKMTLMGYFGNDANNVSNRLMKTVYFVTQ